MQKQPKNSILNVLALSSILCLAPLVSGCAGLRNKPINVATTAEGRVPLAIPDPAPLELDDSRWVVITPKNAAEVWQQLEKQKTTVVLFALTDRGYEQLAINVSKMRNYIQQQREITQKYRDYYEPANPAK